MPAIVLPSATLATFHTSDGSTIAQSAALNLRPRTSWGFRDYMVGPDYYVQTRTQDSASNLHGYKNLHLSKNVA